MTIQLRLCQRAALLLSTQAVIVSPRVAAQTAQAQTAAVQTPSVPTRITQAIDNTNLATLRGNVHRLARPEFDQGAAAESAPSGRMIVSLQRSQEQETALRQLLDQQQSKDSKNYHAWLTPDQFAKQFAPAAQDIQTVTDWLQSQGFQIHHIAAGGMFIEFTGTVGQVSRAFHIEIHRFVVNSEAHFANVSDPQIPAALTPVVASITSLHNFPRRSHAHRSGVFQRSKDSGEVRPLLSTTSGCGSSHNQPCFALGPADFAKIYNVPGTINGNPPGQGQTIAIVNDSNINIADAQAFRKFFGLAANDPQIILNGPDPGVLSGSQGDEGEADLDVQWSAGIASAATIDLVLSESPTTLGAAGIDLSALYIVENNLAPVMSVSFGDCEPTTGDTFFNALWEQAAAQGITVTVSTGDNGSAACDGGSTTTTAASHGLMVSGLAASQFNIAVGGTDFDDATNPTTFWNTTNTAGTQASAKSYINETTWNDSCAGNAAAGSLGTCATVNSNGDDLIAGSGGPSAFVTKPVWQTGTGVPPDGKRDLPDVSLFASDGPKTNNFYIVCQADAISTSANSCATTGTAQFLGVGGTSASAPAFAAIMALVNQQTGQRQGNANYVLYKLAAQSGASCNSSSLSGGQLTSNSCVFYDTTKGNISVACKGGTPNCSNTTSGQFGVLVDPAATTTPAWTTTAGYDRATGLGSVNVANLLAKWNTVSFTASTTTITSPASGATFTHGQLGENFTVTVSPSSATGDVSLIAQPIGAAQVALGPFKLTSGSASISTNLLPGGTAYPVVAHYAGDGTIGASDSAPVTVTVTRESSKTTIALFTLNGTTVTNTNAAAAPYGSPYVLRIDVTNTAGTSCANGAVPCPTGTLTVTDNGNPLNDFNGKNTTVLSNLGFSEDQPVQLPVGTHALVAAYAGDTSFLPSTSATDSISITKASTTTAVTSSATTVASGGSVTLTANITTNSSGAGPTGTVQFMNGSTALGAAAACTPTAAVTTGSNPTTASCKATLTTTLSFLKPPSAPRHIPRSPVGLLWIAAALLLMTFLLSLRRMPLAQHRGYAYAGLLLFACLVAGIAGCSGAKSSSSGNSGGGSSHTDSITGVYSGDSNYAASTSTAVAVTIQ
jgi:subtilase family serine protease